MHRRNEIVVPPVFSPWTPEQKILPPLFPDSAASGYRFWLPFLVAALQALIFPCYTVVGLS
jgi:hypothetical protein